MAFDFTHDGHTYSLDTEGGEVHCKQVDTELPAPQPMEPSPEGADA